MISVAIPVYNEELNIAPLVERLDKALVLIGPADEGAFILFFLVGTQFFALGLIGEYVGGTYREVRHRPRYLVRPMHGKGT